MVSAFRRLPQLWRDHIIRLRRFPSQPSCHWLSQHFFTTKGTKLHEGNATKGTLHEAALPIGTAFHERTFALCQSLNYREWSGYYTVSVYEVHHEHEYNAIRNACALIDISPLYKYLITGKDATKLVNR